MPSLSVPSCRGKHWSRKGFGLELVHPMNRLGVCDLVADEHLGREGGILPCMWLCREDSEGNQQWPTSGIAMLGISGFSTEKLHQRPAHILVEELSSS